MRKSIGFLQCPSSSLLIGFGYTSSVNKSFARKQCMISQKFINSFVVIANSTDANFEIHGHFSTGFIFIYLVNAFIHYIF